MTDLIQVVTTTDREDEAKCIADEVVERRLAACVQILGPIKSIFRWDNRLEEAQEWLLIMKTRKDLYAELEEAIRDAHHYEVPEILALPVIAGNQAYLDWVRKETSESI